MKQKMVRDVMTRGVVSVSWDVPAIEVAKTMAEYNVSAVAVVYPDGSVAGVISEMDILEAYEKMQLEHAVAEDIMTPHIESLKPTTTLEEAARHMVKRRIHRLLVLSERMGCGTRPVGVISASDIIKEIAKSLGETT